jgi:predicted nucleic acid-binding protein
MTESMTPLKIVSVGDKEQRGAAATLRRFSDQDLTIADALGLFLMRDRRISVCWSTDFHLGLGGAELVISSR